MSIFQTGLARSVSEQEASQVLGGDFLVPNGPDSNSDPNARFLLVYEGQPNYDQETLSQQQYYNRYQQGNSACLLTFGVNMNNNSTYANTLELVMGHNASFAGHRTNDAVINQPISAISRFMFVYNDTDAPIFSPSDFVDGKASSSITPYQSTLTLTITVTLTDLGNGTTRAFLDGVGQ